MPAGPSVSEPHRAAEPCSAPPAGPVLQADLGRPQWVGFAIVLIALASVAGVLAVAGPVAQRIYSEDGFIPLDGAWRIANRERPHADFYCPPGALWLVPTALFLNSHSPSASALAFSAAFWTSVLGLWAWRVSDSRLSQPGRVLLAVSTGLLAGGAHNLGGHWSNSTYAMSYNRLGFALLVVLLTALLPPRRSGGRDRHGFDVGLALGALLLGKLNFFGTACAAVALAAVLSPPSRRWLAGAAAGFAATFLPFAVWMRFDLAAAAADAAMVAAVQDWPDRLRGIAACADANSGLIASAALVAAATLGGTGRAAARLRRPAALLGVIGAGVVLCGTNYQKGGIPLLPLAGLFAAEFLARSPARPGRRFRIRLAAASAISAILWIPATIADGLGIVHAAAWNFGEGAAVPEDERLHAAPLRGLIILPTESARGHENLEYRDAVNDGLQLLSGRVRPDDRIGTVDFANPFSFALGLRPPAGPLWWDMGKTFTRAVHPAAGRAWGDATLLLIPREPGGRPHALRDALMAIYGDYVSQQFEPVAESARWRLLRRRRVETGPAGGD